MSMPKTHEGELNGAGLRIAVIASRWNSFITEQLLEGALGALQRNGVAESDLSVTKVPGTWEIPVAAKKLATSGNVEAVVCIGCIIRGATPHFDYLASNVTNGLGRIAIDSGIPVTYGILTVENIEQAIERYGTKACNKGAEAALAAIEMANLMRSLQNA
jgi:6,7-dimethyl-8-ribityllumazine synthase